MHRWWVAGAVLVCCASAAVAGDNRSVAREAFREGTRLYDLGDYQHALEQFKKAYLNFEEPAILFNTAQCERQIGDKPEAVKLYKSYLRKVTNAPNRAEVEGLVQRLETEIAQEQATKNKPPEGMLAPAAPVPVEPAARVQPPKTAEKTPLYKKWWLWTAVGGVAAVAIAVGLSVGLTETRGSSFDAGLGTYGPKALVQW